MIYKKILEYLLASALQHTLVFLILIYIFQFTLTVQQAASVVAAVEAVKFLSINCTIGE